MFRGGDIQFWFVLGLLHAGIITWALWRLRGFPNEALLNRWFSYHGVPQTEASIALVTQALRRTKRIRTYGTMAVWAGWLAWTLATTERVDEIGSWPIIPLFATWSVAVVIAAVWPNAVLSDGDSARGVIAEQRSVDAYRPAFWEHDREALFGLLASVLVMATIAPGSGDNSFGGSQALRLVLPALAVMGLVWLAQTFVVRRHRAFESPDLAYADDALRTGGVSALAGIGYAVPLALVAIGISKLTSAHFDGGFVVLPVVLVLVILWVAVPSVVFALARLDGEAIVYGRGRVLGPTSV